MTIHCFYMGLKNPRKIPFSPLNWLTLIFIISHLIPQVTFLQSLPFCLYLFKFSLTLTILWLHRRIILWILLFSPNSLFQTLFIYLFFYHQALPLYYFLPLLMLTSLSLSLPSYWEKKETILDHRRNINNCLNWLIREMLNDCGVNLVCCFWMISTGVSWAIKAASGFICLLFHLCVSERKNYKEQKYYLLCQEEKKKKKLIKICMIGKIIWKHQMKSRGKHNGC